MSLPKVTLFLPSLDGGGAERVFVQLANEFARLGYPVDLALASARGPYVDEISNSVRVIDFDARGVLHALPKLVRYLRSERPNVMLSGLDHANIVAVASGCLARSRTRCVISIRSVPTAVYREARSTRSWGVFRLMRIAYRLADGIIANSEAVARDVSEFVGIERSRLQVIYNPVDCAHVEALSHERVSHDWCDSGAPPLILGVGSLTVLKDFSSLIHAFAVVRSKRDCRLVILGDGPERPKLERLIRELQLRDDVYLPGFVSNPFAWMRRAGVFVSSSLTEGCPNALMQALVCGTPVVSTDCPGGSSEILQGGKWGRLVAVRDPAAMAEAIASALDDGNRIDGKCRASDFAHDRIARQYLLAMLPRDSAPMAEG